MQKQAFCIRLGFFSKTLLVQKISFFEKNQESF